ncbi:8804_t:CDS:2, partial [Entrophospora sp. SA101]
AGWSNSIFNNKGHLGRRIKCENMGSDALAQYKSFLHDKLEVDLKKTWELRSNFYVQAKVPDTTYIYVNVGFGFHPQLTLDEAIEFIDKKEKTLQRKSEKYTDDIAKISAHIAMVHEAIAEILYLQKGEEIPKRDDLFI